MRYAAFTYARLLFFIVVSGITTSAYAGTRCLTVEIIKPELMFPGTTAFIDNSDTSSRIVECDAQGNMIWEYEIPVQMRPQVRFANDLEWLPDKDSFLFTSRGNGIYEVARDKSIVWSYATDKVSHDADRLPNGNTIFVWGGDSDDDAQITEVTVHGKIVWQWKGKKHLAGEQRHDIPAGRREPYSYTHANAVTRLPSGNTLASLRNFHMLVEISQDGQIVWKLRNLPRVHDPFILPNGNLLVSLLVRPDYHPIREITRGGEVVWEYSQHDLLSPTTVAQLPNGNVLIAGRNMVVEVTREKEIVWRAILPGVRPTFDNQQQHLYKVVRIPARP